MRERAGEIFRIFLKQIVRELTVGQGTGTAHVVVVIKGWWMLVVKCCV